MYNKVKINYKALNRQKRLNQLNKINKLVTGNLFFYKRHSNIFLILLSSRWKHISTLTAGNCKMGKNKKKKTSPFNMLNIVAALKQLLLKHNLKFLNFYLKQRFSRHFYNLRKMFRLNEIKINKYIYLLNKSYGLNKKRKVRRI